MPGPSAPFTLLSCAAVGVIGMIVLIARFKVHAFPALILASLFVGLCSGTSLPRIARAFEQGVGGMLSSIASVVGLGMIIGRLLAVSGGAEVVAGTLIKAFGQQRLPWTLLLIGFLVGIPVFFTVGVVLLVPILFTIVRETKRPMLELAIPLLAGLSVVHGLVPPHPGPMAAIGLTQADAGKVLLYSLAIGLPTACLAGPLFGRVITRWVAASASPVEAELAAKHRPTKPPGFCASVGTILLPVALMLLGTIAALAMPKENRLRVVCEFLGSPLIAMFVATLAAYYVFGLARGFDRQQLLNITEECLAPAASILLVVGAGGGFNRVLIAGGVGDALTSVASEAHLSPLFLGWSLAALTRIATGSATVAITTAAGIVAPFAARTPGTNLELLVVAMGAGSLVLSHVNDGGFWFVKEYLGLSVIQTLRTWTIMETIIGVAGLLGAMALNVLLQGN